MATQQDTNGLEVNHHIRHTLTRVQVVKLLKEAARADGAVGLRDHAILKLLYATGMHIGELISLNLDCLHLAKGGGYAQCCGKNSRERIVQIPSGVVQTLKFYLENGRPMLVRDAREPAVFVNKVNLRGTSSERLTRQGCWILFRKYARRARIRSIVSPSTLRHSRAIHMLKRGATLHQVQQRLGYANMSTTIRAYRWQ